MEVRFLHGSLTYRRRFIAGYRRATTTPVSTPFFPAPLVTACREVRFRGHSHRCTQLYTGIQSSTDVGFSRVGVRRVHAYLGGESPQKSPHSNCIALLTTRRASRKLAVGKNSASAQRGGGVRACDSRSILRVLRDCSVHPQGPSLHSEPFIGTDARLVHRRNKMECLWVVRWVSRGKSDATTADSQTPETNKKNGLGYPL